MTFAEESSCSCDKTASQQNLHAVSYLDCAELLKEMDRGNIQRPLFICCSDMGAFIPGLKPGLDVLVMQNFGHQLPDEHEFCELIESYDVRHVIVLGHKACAYAEWLWSSQNAARDEPPYSGTDRVVAEIKRILSSARITEKIDKDELVIHAWFYEDLNREMLVFDPAENGFTGSGS